MIHQVSYYISLVLLDSLQTISDNKLHIRVYLFVYFIIHILLNLFYNAHNCELLVTFSFRL